MDLDAYKRRLKEKSSSQALVNATIKQVKSMFANSPLYKVVELNNEEKGVRFSFDKDGEYQILLMPEEPINKGDIVEADGEKWLVFETVQDVIYPKGKIVLCNQNLAWTDSSGIKHEYPAVVKGRGYGLKMFDLRESKYMLLAEGQVIASVPYNDYTKEIKPTSRFKLGEGSFSVVGVDNITHIHKDVGFLDITLQVTSKPIEDETEPDEKSSDGWGGGW